MAGRRIADLLIKIGADSYEFKQKAKEVESGLGALSKRLTSVGKTMSLAVTTPLVALGVVATKAFSDADKAAAKVRTGIEATGGAAKLSLQELQSFAAGLQKNTLFEDDQILNDVTAKLLTFTNIAGNAFKRTEQAVLDVATVLDKDLASVTIQLGKALNDPVKNLSALGRMGIQFSKEQTEVIRTLAETNRLAEAQGLILDTLASKYGGQAEAAAQAGTGILTQLKNNWGDLMEQLGEIILPVVQAVGRALNSLVLGLQNMDPSWKKFIVTVAALAAAIGPVLVGLGGILKILPLLKAGFALLTSPLGLVITAIAAGVTLLASFAGNARDAAEANGKLTNQVVEESRQVNGLIAQLTSANTSELQRKAALDELKRIQPAIVEGLSNEATELQTLKQRAAEYNQQLVLRIALARKQDEVAAAIERQTEAGVKQANKEAELYGYLAKVGSQLQAGAVKVGSYDVHTNSYSYLKASAEQQRALIKTYNDIMTSGDSLEQKARRMQSLITRYGPTNNLQISGISADKIGRLSKKVQGLQKDVSKAGEGVSEAEAEVANFAKTFSLTLTEAVAEATNEVVGLGAGAAQITSPKLPPIKQEIEVVPIEVEKFKPVIPEHLRNLTIPINPPKFELSTSFTKAREQIKAIHAFLKEALFGWADQIGGAFAADLGAVGAIVKGYTDALTAKGWEFSKALEFVGAKVAETIRQFDQELSNFLANSIVAAAEAIGQIIAGDMGFGGLMKAILLQFASFLKNIGAQLIEFGIMMIAFKTVLKSVLANPWAAIAVGAAMVAAAALMTALVNKNAKNNAPKLAKGGLAFGPTYAMVGDNPNARVDPEVIAPLSKLKNLMTGGGSTNVNITLTGELRAKGRDLVYALGQENFKTNILGG